MDNPMHRARRVLLPALAWLLALGQPMWIVHVYSVLNIVAWLALAAVLWRLLPVHDLRSWLAWAAVLFSGGTITSVRRALTDSSGRSPCWPAACSPSSGLEVKTGAGLVAAASLARETSLLALAGILWETVAVAGKRPTACHRRRTACCLADSHLMAPWSGRHRMGQPDAAPGRSGRKVGADVSAALHSGDRPLAWTTMAATLGLIVQAVYLATRPRLDDGWWRIGAVYGLLMLCLNSPVWDGFPGAATRVLLPMTLAFNVLIVRNRASAAWLIAGNLAVLNGYLVMRQTLYDTRELAAGHVGAAAVVARTDNRWFNVERGWRHATAWSPAHSALELETWPHDHRTIELDASVRSHQRLVLTIAQDGVVLWRNTVFERPLHIALPCQVRNGRARVDFSAGTPGAPPGTNAEARTPLFAVEDLRFRSPP